MLVYGTYLGEGISNFPSGPSRGGIHDPQMGDKNAKPGGLGNLRIEESGRATYE